MDSLSLRISKEEIKETKGKMRRYPFYQQLDQMDCGPSCLRMISKYYNRFLGREKLRNIVGVNREGASLFSLANAAEKLGFRTLGVKLSLEQISNASLPCILLWNQEHYVVLYKRTRSYFLIGDPAYGLIKLTKKEFKTKWSNDLEGCGIGLFLQPSLSFYSIESEDIPSNPGLGTVLEYVKPYKSYIYQLVLGVLAVGLIQLAFPFITQNIIDSGILNKDLNLIVLLLISQLFLFFGKASVELVRSWLILHLSHRISINMLSDFFILLLSKSLSYFETRVTGDILQRINDHNRIEQLLTNGSIGTLFSIFNIFIFGLVLLYYSYSLFFAFFLGSAIYIIWILLFMKKRRDIDYKRFDKLGENQSKMIEIVHGIHEIKLNGAERSIRWSWENIQSSLYKISKKSLGIEQAQTVGASAINELKNILLIFLAASLAVKGQITVGVLLAVSYIIGQLNTPLVQLLSFIQSLQDARIALERINEIRAEEDEERSNVRSEVISDMTLIFDGVSFHYPGSDGLALENINLMILEGKTTAIVGKSGSGKTTLMKLILQFHKTSSGRLSLGGIDLNDISPRILRQLCGNVLQEGYIFNDTIERNIALGDLNPNIEKLKTAIEIAELKDTIMKLPQGLKTMVGVEGQGLSGGEKQRILIARAVYKDPKLFLFDEATSSLDAINERRIMQNLYTFMKGRTAVIIAHRLSTVKFADQIVVMQAGKVVELGNHFDLIERKGVYFDLVSNQLEFAKAS